MYEQTLEIQCADEAAARACTVRPRELPAGKTLAFATRWDDRGPSNFKMAETLAGEGIKATFYLNGFDAPAAADYAARAGREMLPRGHSIGNHTLSHRMLGPLLPAERFRDILEQRARSECAAGAPVTAFVLPYCTSASAADADAERCTAECLVRAGMLGGAESGAEFGLEPCDWVGTHLFAIDDSNPKEKLFTDAFAKGKEIALAGKLRDGPYLTLGVHAWQKDPEGFAELARIVRAQARKPEIWYCNANEYSAYRLQYLRAKVEKTGVSGTKAVFRVTRPDPAALGANVPLAFDVSDGRTAESPNDSALGLPRAYALLENALTLDRAANRVTAIVSNATAEALSDGVLTLRLPPLWKTGVLTERVPALAPGATTVLSFELGEKETGGPRAAQADQFLAAQVDARGAAGGRVRLWLTGFDRINPRPTACPRDAARIAGPLPGFADGTNSTPAALSRPGAPLGDIGADPEGHWRGPGPLRGAAEGTVYLATDAFDVRAAQARHRGASWTDFLVAWDFEAAAGTYRLPAGMVCDYGVRTYLDGAPLRGAEKGFALAAGRHRLVFVVRFTNKYALTREIALIPASR